MRSLVYGFLAAGLTLAPAQGQEKPSVHVGFGEADVTPKLDERPVWLAGFNKGRKATEVSDPLRARAFVLEHLDKKIAVVSVDVIGLFHDLVEKVRQDLPGFHFVLVTSTHTHAGPDTLGMWGPNFFTTGVDPDYLKQIEAGVVKAVRQADASKKLTTVVAGMASDPELLHDSRLPIVKHDELVVLRFILPDGKNAGMVVQWNSHPEALDRKNTRLSADFVGVTTELLRKRHGCPVVYLSGTLGGLMAPRLRADEAEKVVDGTEAMRQRYGELVADLADRASASAKPVKLTPMDVRTRTLYLPIDNAAFQIGWRTGVLRRQAYQLANETWTPVAPKDAGRARLGIKSEVSLLRLGEVQVAAIPGEIYPELVLGKVVDPAEPEADFPEAPVEPAIYAQLTAPVRMVVGLANDEIGYILPRRQWDERPPYAYGRKTAPYGEINSLGPDTASRLCEAFRDLAR